MDILDGGPPGNSGIIVINPPYGERVSAKDDLAAFYPRLGDALKQRHVGWTAYVLSADPALPKLIGLKATRRTPLFNGPLECRLFEYRMVAGSLRPAKEPRSGTAESR
jgi:putative N6-adenine-specific DNA methylase